MSKSWVRDNLIEKQITGLEPPFSKLFQRRVKNNYGKDEEMFPL